MLYADDLVIIRLTIVTFRHRFLKWNEAFEFQCLNVNIVKTKAMVSGGIPQNGLSTGKVYQCGICGLRIKIS